MEIFSVDSASEELFEVESALQADPDNPRLLARLQFLRARLELDSADRLLPWFAEYLETLEIAHLRVARDGLAEAVSRERGVSAQLRRYQDTVATYTTAIKRRLGSDKDPPPDELGSGVPRVPPPGGLHNARRRRPTD